MISIWSRLVPSGSQSGESPKDDPGAPESAAIAHDMDGELQRDFGDVYAVCREATDEVIALLTPGGYDCSSYISLSMLRLARVARTLKSRVPPQGRVLDFWLILRQRLPSVSETGLPNDRAR